MICAPRFAASLIPEIAFLRFASGFWSQLICTNPTVVELLARIFLTMPRSISKGKGEWVRGREGERERGRRGDAEMRGHGALPPHRVTASPRHRITASPRHPPRRVTPSPIRLRRPLAASVFGRFGHWKVDSVRCPVF